MEKYESGLGQTSRQKLEKERRGYKAVVKRANLVSENRVLLRGKKVCPRHKYEKTEKCESGLGQTFRQRLEKERRGYKAAVKRANLVSENRVLPRRKKVCPRH